MRRSTLNGGYIGVNKTDVKKGIIDLRKLIRIKTNVINDIFENAPGRLIVSTFSSNISRIQQIVEAAVAHKKKLVIIGRSMENAVSMSRQLGYIRIPDASIVASEDIRSGASSAG